MSQEDPLVVAARADVGRARQQLLATARQLQERLKPATLARDAWEGAKVKGADLAEDAVDAVKARPALVGAAAAALTLFLAREPIADLAGRAVDEVKTRRKRKASPSVETSEAAPRRRRKTETR